MSFAVRVVEAAVEVGVEPLMWAGKEVPTAEVEVEVPDWKWRIVEEEEAAEAPTGRLYCFRIDMDRNRCCECCDFQLYLLEAEAEVGEVEQLQDSP